MSNRNRGEVSLGKYTLRFTTNSLCELEDKLGMGINQIAAQLADRDKMRVRMMVAVVWAGLLDRQPSTTVEQAGELITEVGLSKAMEAVSDAFVLTFGEPDRPTQPVAEAPAKVRKGEAVMTGGTGSTS